MPGLLPTAGDKEALFSFQNCPGALSLKATVAPRRVLGIRASKPLNGLTFANQDITATQQRLSLQPSPHSTLNRVFHRDMSPILEQTPVVPLEGTLLDPYRNPY